MRSLFRLVLPGLLTLSLGGLAGIPAAAAQEPAPAPAPVSTAPSHLRVEVRQQPMAAPSPAELDRLRMMAEKSRARGLAIGGVATLGGAYALSALVGTIAMDAAEDRRRRLYGGWMTVPVGGPFIAAFYARSHTGRLLTASLGAAQAVGLTVAVVGLLRHRRLQRRISLAAAPTPDGGAVSMAMRF